jgi:hypothetical protein
MQFENAICIEEFLIQTQTDDNNIKPGCEYELMYWDNSWISADRKTANDTILTFHNIPSETAYWVINNNEGIEEQIFLYVENAQYWPSVSCYDIQRITYLTNDRLCIK